MKRHYHYLILLATTCISSTSAMAATYGQMHTGGVAYDQQHKRTMFIEKGAQLQITEAHTTQDVYEIVYDEQTMLLNKETLFVRKVVETITEVGVKVRQEPDPESEMIKTLEVGEQVSAMYQTPNANWYQVILSDGQEGFIYKSQLTDKDLSLLPVKDFSKPKVEEIWWSEASRVLARGDVATIEDVYTGKKFQIKRTFGTNHADIEALTKADTAMVKEIWGGFTWERRPVIVHIDGRRLAASLSGMPHAGDTLNAITNNGMSGVMDLHFRGSRKHAEGKITATTDPLHQNAITIAVNYQ